MRQPNLQVTSAFATPIVSTELADADGLNGELRRLFLAREAEGDRYRKKSRTPTDQFSIFESEFNLFQWADPPVQKLRAFCLDALGRTVMMLNDYSPEQTQLLPTLKLSVDCWFHITRSGGYIGSHNHPMASWSGVYCVWPGADADRAGSGLLRFLDARPSASMYLDPGNVRMKAPFGPGNIDFKLRGGQLLLFPSYLAHEVTPFHGSDERITVAFNCSFTRPANTPSFGF